MGVEGEPAGNDMTRPSTQVGPRPVEAGLGGNDDGAWGSTRGSKTHRFCFENGDDWQCPIAPPSVIFVDK